MANIKRALELAMNDHNADIKQVAARCGYTKSAIYNSFYYRKNPTLKTIQKVAGCFGMSVSEFIKLGE